MPKIFLIKNRLLQQQQRLLETSKLPSSAVDNNNSDDSEIESRPQTSCLPSPSPNQQHVLERRIKEEKELEFQAKQQQQLKQERELEQQEEKRQKKEEEEPVEDIEVDEEDEGGHSDDSEEQPLSLVVNKGEYFWGFLKLFQNSQFSSKEKDTKRPSVVLYLFIFWMHFHNSPAPEVLYQSCSLASQILPSVHIVSAACPNLPLYDRPSNIIHAYKSRVFPVSSKAQISFLT